MQTVHAAESGISIHLAPEILGHFFGIPITNTLITVWFVMFLIVTFLVLFHSRISLVPQKTQVILEMLIGGAYDAVASALQDERIARRFFPLIMTIFLFILAINWVGLLPGVDAFGFYQNTHGVQKLVPFLHPGNTDLNITLGFTIVAFFTIELAGIAYLGFMKYASKFINVKMFRQFNTKNVMGFFIGIIELFSEIARLISFSFRLFGNIFAGKTLILVALFFAPFILPVPLLAFELFVGLIQAFIFAVLTLFFIKLAIEEPH